MSVIFKIFYKTYDLKNMENEIVYFSLNKIFTNVDSEKGINLINKYK